MFTVEIKINGTLIGHIYGHNTGDQVEGKTVYNWHYYSTEEQDVSRGHILHKREDGINALVAAILGKVSKCTS